MFGHRKIAILLILSLWLVGIASAEEYEIRLSQIDTADYPTITIYANVLDASGNQVGGLGRSDFRVTEDGTAVPLTDFAGATESRPVDVVFVFDVTGSMGSQIEGMKRTAIQFALKLRENNRDFRLGLVTFSDRVEAMYKPDGSLTEDENEFRRWIEELQARGGGRDPENSYGALKAAAQMQFRDSAQVVFILITDAPPHKYGDPPDDGVRFDDPDLTLPNILALLQPEAVTVYPVAIDIPEFRELAAETGGRFYDMERNPNFTEIIEEIGETIAGQYRLTYVSPRPNYDGTRRDIQVAVSKGDLVITGEGRYVERHLLHIESNGWIGLLLLLPLLAALAIPYLWQRQSSGGSLVYTPDPVPPPPMTTCPGCHSQIREGARFCANCGYNLSALFPVVVNCPRCQSSMRPGARFCASCGYAANG